MGLITFFLNTEIKFEGNEAESIIIDHIAYKRITFIIETIHLIVDIPYKINKSYIQEEKEIKKEENSFKTVLSEFYIPQIVVNNNIIGIDDEYMFFKAQDMQNDFVDIEEDEQIIKDNISINNFLYGLNNAIKKMIYEIKIFT